MNPQTLIQWIERPETMNDDCVVELEQVLRYYPCFSAARMLYLKALKQVGDLKYSGELFRTSLSVPDRSALFYFMKGLPYLAQPQAASSDENSGDFSLIEDFLDGFNSEKSSLVPDYSGYSLEKEFGDGQGEETPDKIIQQFLEEQAVETPSTLEAPFSEISSEASSDGSSEAYLETEDSSYEAPSVIPECSFTETLARIYLKQKKYESALEIFKSLLLKNPEKSTYFADQIRFLEKLINHLNK